MEMSGKVVSIVMGSESDLAVMQAAADVLRDFDVGYEMRILSAHRVPDVVAKFASDAPSRGIKVVIAGAGWAAHLAGAIAAHATIPVIGVPIDSSPLNGWDALLSTVQMPPGVPVATVSVGKGGAKNAAYLAIEILALADDKLRERLQKFRQKMRESVLAGDSKIQRQFAGEV